nr:ATPase 8, plasma membrane-type-like isoform X2 [Tanacetum cinerariifolium]
MSAHICMAEIQLIVVDGDEILYDFFHCKQIVNEILWEVEGKIIELCQLKGETLKRAEGIFKGFANRGLRSLTVAHQRVPEKTNERAGTPWEFVGLSPVTNLPLIEIEEEDNNGGGKVNEMEKEDEDGVGGSEYSIVDVEDIKNVELGILNSVGIVVVSVEQNQNIEGGSKVKSVDDNEQRGSEVMMLMLLNDQIVEGASEVMSVVNVERVRIVKEGIIDVNDVGVAKRVRFVFEDDIRSSDTDDDDGCCE